MTSNSFSVLPSTIQALLEKRAGHSEAISEIDATMARVSKALGTAAAMPAMPASPRPMMKKIVLKKPKVKAVAPKVKATRKSKKGGPTAAEFVIDVVKSKKNPTSQEVNAAWKAAGRNWTADITLSQMTKAKKLVRTPLGAGIRGSRYTLPA